jgi:quercetin dioxygenase-like cupin family protein
VDEAYKLFPDVAKELVPPADGILSRTLFAGDRLKVVGFAFAEGEELSEHTAACPAVLHVLAGEATLTLGGGRHEVTAGAWVHMPAKLPHSVKARAPLTMLLLLLK